VTVDANCSNFFRVVGVTINTDCSSKIWSLHYECQHPSHLNSHT